MELFADCGVSGSYFRLCILVYVLIAAPVAVSVLMQGWKVHSQRMARKAQEPHAR